MNHRGVTTAATGLILLTVGVSGCSGRAAPDTEGGPLRAIDMNGAAVDIGNSQHSDTWSFGDFSVCVEHVPKSLEIKSIGLFDATGTPAVTGKYYIGADTTDLAPFALPERYAGVGPVDVSRVKVSSCPPEGDVFTVGVEMRSREHWSAKGIRMVYDADGSEFVARWPFPMEVCAIDNDPSPKCAREATPSPT